MKEFLEGEQDRLADLQVEALQEITVGARNSAEATLAEAERTAEVVKGLIEDAGGLEPAS